MALESDVSTGTSEEVISVATIVSEPEEASLVVAGITVETGEELVDSVGSDNVAVLMNPAEEVS